VTPLTVRRRICGCARMSIVIIGMSAMLLALAVRQVHNTSPKRGDIRSSKASLAESEAAMDRDQTGDLEAPVLTYELAGARPYVHIVWDYSSATTFNIYRARSQAGPWETVNAQPYPANAHSAADYDYPINAVVLYYRVTPLTADGEEGPPSPSGHVALPDAFQR
jgi:hypothetical protein